MARLHGPFRMAIDRTFTVAGHGTVVTGSVSSGACAVGDELMIEPGAIQVRVRGIQHHEQSVERVVRGQRAAINLVGVHHEEIHRGHELASPGHLRASRIITARLSLLPSLHYPLKSRDRVRVHVGTAELLASVKVLEGNELAAGTTGYVQLFLSQPAVTTWGQPFVLRSESPVLTLGGGCVLDPEAQRLRRPDAQTLEQVRRLDSSNERERASASLFLAGLRDWQPDDWRRSAEIWNVDQAFAELQQGGEIVELQISPTRRLRLHKQVLERLSDRIAAALETVHTNNPLRLTIDRTQLASGFSYLADRSLFDAALEQLRQQGRVRLTPGTVALVGHGPKLSTNEQKLLVQLVEQYRTAGVEPPTVAELQSQAVRNQAAVPSLVSLAADDGQLVRISKDIYLHRDVERQIREQLTAKLADGLTVSQIREILNTSRKFAVPICEYFDRVGFTRREGDVRFLAAPLPALPPDGESPKA